MHTHRAIFCLVVTLIALATQLSGCGFRLRGSALPATIDGPVFLAADTGSTIAQDLRRALQDRDVILSEKRQDASIQLDIHSEQIDSRTSAISINTRLREIELRYSITFTAKRSDGEEAQPIQLQIRREYAFDPNEALGSTNERELLHREMRRELIKRLLEHLRSLSKSAE